MATTKTQVIRYLAGNTPLTNKQATAILAMLVEVAVKETKKNGVFVIPGLGRLCRRLPD